MKLYHCSERNDLTMLTPNKPRFSPFFGLFLCPYEHVVYWQKRIAEDGPFPTHVYEVEVPSDVAIYVDEPADRPQGGWVLAEYEWDRTSMHHRQMWVKIPLECRHIGHVPEEWFCKGCSQFVSEDRCPDCGIHKQEQEK